MSDSIFYSGMKPGEIFRSMVKFGWNMQNGNIFPAWSENANLCRVGTFWTYSGDIYQAIKESGVKSTNGVQIPGSDDLQYWSKVSYTSMYMGDDELTILTELNQLRQASIGQPQWATSTTPPKDHALINGDFISFTNYPEFKAKYEAGGFAGLVMSYNADAATRAANRGMFRPDAATPTGLYLPIDGGAYYQAWTSSTNGTAGAHLNAGLPNLTGGFKVAGTGGGIDGISGVFYPVYSGNITNGSSGTGYGCGFDASKSNAIYENSSTVTPDTIKHPVMMYLGRTDKVLQTSTAVRDWAATTTELGLARKATLTDMVPGTTIQNGPAFIDAGSGIITPTPTAHAIPQAGPTGKLKDSWLPATPPYASAVFPSSGNVTASTTGWYFFQAWGGGGAGGAGGNATSGGVGGAAGGTTSIKFPIGSILNGVKITTETTMSAYGGSGGGGGGQTCGGGGGAAGNYIEFWVYLTAGTVYTVTVGAGGVRTTGASSGSASGTAGKGTYSGQGGNQYRGGQGAAGAGNAGIYQYDSNTIGGLSGQGGNGGVTHRTQWPYGHGGGGGGGTGDRAAGISIGGNAGNGAEKGQTGALGAYAYGGAGAGGVVLANFYREIV